MHPANDPIGSAALTNPEAKFEHPMAIVAAGGLSPEAKRAALDRWAADIAQRIKATGEGMTPAPGAPNDATLMDEIAQARRCMDRQPPGCAAAQ